MSWYLGVWRQYATFTGRARRSEYWYFYLFNMIAAFVLSFADVLIGTDYSPLYTLYAFAVFLPSLAVGVRRLHDSDHSGWWLLVPLVNLIFLITEGTPGPNRFGANPKSQPARRPGVTPAGWFPDPTGRHQYRYWDSVRWTSSVADNGVSSDDDL